MPPRSLSDRSPVSVVRWNDELSCGSSCEFKSSPKEVELLGKKSIRFASKNQVFSITHLDDIPQNEVTAIWYDSQDYADIKSAYQATIFLMEAGEKISGDDQTSRGLEYRTQDGAWARFENKRDAYNAVLDEQDRQWKKDIDDQEAIRSVYLEHSMKCLMAAHERALQDSRDIQEFLREPRLQRKSSVDRSKVKKKKRIAHKESSESEVSERKTKAPSNKESGSRSTRSDKGMNSSSRSSEHPSSKVEKASRTDSGSKSGRDEVKTSNSKKNCHGADSPSKILPRVTTSAGIVAPPPPLDKLKRQTSSVDHSKAEGIRTGEVERRHSSPAEVSNVYSQQLLNARASLKRTDSRGETKASLSNSRTAKEKKQTV